MLLFETIAVALMQLRANKMRSFLTILGIMIGIGSVMGVSSIGEGLRKRIVSEFERVGGSSLIVVQPPRTMIRINNRLVRRPWREYLEVEDIRRLSEECEGVRSVIPLNTGSAQLKYQKATTSGEFWGINAEFSEAFGWAVEQGRFIGFSDLNKWRKTAVIGIKIKEDLFGSKSAVGKEIKLNNQRFEVIGVMEEKMMFGDDWGYRVLLPYTTVSKRLTGSDYLSLLFVYTEGANLAETAAEEIRAVLRRYKEHGDEFTVETMEGQIQEINSVINIMKLVVGGIAFISLLVGGIGIMNIMLVSVTERTREIGIRKAVGATRRNILTQFLIESAFLCLFGGIFGVLFGMLLGFGIAAIITQLANEPFPSVISIQAVLTACIFSVLWGMIFGVAPARKAAKLHPIEALRYE